MSSISNRFFVTAIEDGTTLHGSILSTKALSQTWISSGAAAPDWTIDDNRPIIYIKLYNGDTEITSTSFSGYWEYDGQQINFNSGTSTDGKFQETTYGRYTHAIKIIDNLATSSSNDSHYISFKGSYTPENATLALRFTVSLKINLSLTAQGGYFGIIEFEGGKNYFDTTPEFLTLKPHFYGSGSSAEIVTSEYTVEYLINNTYVPNGGTENGSRVISGNELKLSDQDVVDNAIITAKFKRNTASGYDYIAYTSVDDLKDPEFMYIQYNNSNGQTATLRDGEQIKFYAWIGTTTSSTPIPTYNHFNIKFLDSSGEVNIDDLTEYDIEEDTRTIIQGGDGWRKLTVGSSSEYPDGVNRAYCTITHGLVKHLGNNLTGIILAEQVTNS